MPSNLEVKKKKRKKVGRSGEQQKRMVVQTRSKTLDDEGNNGPLGEQNGESTGKDMRKQEQDKVLGKYGKHSSAVLQGRTSRKRPSSVSSADSPSSISSGRKPAKVKRVSFARKLEHAKSLDSFDDSIPLQTPTTTPNKGILRSKAKTAGKISPLRRKDSSPADKLTPQKNTDASVKKKRSVRLQQKDDVMQVEEAKTEEAESMEVQTSGLRTKKVKGQVKMQVTRKTKAKLLTMPRKERKAYLRQLRAKKRPNFELATKCKLLWERIRSSKTKKETQDEAVQELCGLVKGRAKELIFAHDTCRVIECLMTLKRPGIRSMLCQELLSETVAMSTSKYARFFVIKMLRYGSGEERGKLITAMHRHVQSLARNRWGADVLEAAYNDYANAQQRSDLMIEFYGKEFTVLKPDKPTTLSEILAKEPAKKQSILRNMEELIKDIVGKPAFKHSIMHRLLLEFLENCSEEQKVEMIDSIKERVVEIIHTRDGSRIALHAIWNSSSKDRKIIVRSFKGLAVNACLEEYGSVVLMGLFDCVDDTVVVKKCIIKDMADNIKKIISSKYGIKVITYLAYPRYKRQFLKETVELLAKGDGNLHSKKAKNDRYAELWAGISEALLTFVANNMRELIFETSTSLLLLSLFQTTDVNTPFERQVSDDQRAQCYQAIVDIARDEFIACNMEERFHIVEHPQAHFVVTQLLISDKKLRQNENNTTLASLLASIDTEQLASWTACNKGCFVLLHMYESGDASGMQAVSKVVQTSMKRLKGYSTPGAALLLQKVH